MARYVDGFLLPLPKKNLAAYRRISRAAGKVWEEFGALEYLECVADDSPMQGTAPFEKRVGTKKGETVLFSFIVYKSKAQRDRVNKQVMEDPRMIKLCNAMQKKGGCPFDLKRMSYGGFRAIVDMGVSRR